MPIPGAETVGVGIAKAAVGGAAGGAIRGAAVPLVTGLPRLLRSWFLSRLAKDILAYAVAKDGLIIRANTMHEGLQVSAGLEVVTEKNNGALANEVIIALEELEALGFIRIKSTDFVLVYEATGPGRKRARRIKPSPSKRRAQQHEMVALSSLASVILALIYDAPDKSILTIDRRGFRSKGHAAEALKVGNRYLYDYTDQQKEAEFGLAVRELRQRKFLEPAPVPYQIQKGGLREVMSPDGQAAAERMRSMGDESPTPSAPFVPVP